MSDCCAWVLFLRTWTFSPTFVRVIGTTFWRSKQGCCCASWRLFNRQELKSHFPPSRCISQPIPLRKGAKFDRCSCFAAQICSAISKNKSRFVFLFNLQFKTGACFAEGEQTFGAQSSKQQPPIKSRAPRTGVSPRGGLLYDLESFPNGYEVKGEARPFRLTLAGWVLRSSVTWHGTIDQVHIAPGGKCFAFSLRPGQKRSSSTPPRNPRCAVWRCAQHYQRP